MANTCSVESCGRPCVGRGLCDLHYYRAKRAGTLDEIAPTPRRSCAHCAATIPASKRYGARFCSIECKEAARGEEDARLRQRKRLGRVCAQCFRQIPMSRNVRAVACSPECQVKLNNRKKQAAREEGRPPRLPCPWCEKPIPDDKRWGTVYCSTACKKAAAAHRWRGRSPGYMRQRNYGVSQEQYDAMVEAQSGRCAICGIDKPGGQGGWHVDHCHKSGKIRGLLCHNCNVGLGNFKDDPKLLRSAIRYLT